MKKIKTILLILLISLIGIVNVNASVPETKNREGLDNLGVNKKWKITDKNKSNVLRTKYVNAEEKIYDFSNILTDEDYEKVKQEATELKEAINMDVVILIDNLPYTQDIENEDYAADFYDYNDFGIDIKHYSGVLLFRNTYEADPYYNIYTFGEAQIYFNEYRLEPILDDIYDNLHAGNYYDGFHQYLGLLKDNYNKGKPSYMDNYIIDENGYLQKLPNKYRPPIFLAIIISSIVGGIVIGIMIGKNKMIMKATQAEEYLDGKSVNISLNEDRFISSHTTHYTTSSSSGGGGGGGSFHSSSGSSGGGHSSGSGRHG